MSNLKKGTRLALSSESLPLDEDPWPGGIQFTLCTLERKEIAGGLPQGEDED